MQNPCEPQTFHTALKEWALLCDLLASGRQSLLLRKGGIYESGGEFELEHKQFLLYPTYVHQDAAMLKPEYAAQVMPTAQEPAKIEINCWARVYWIAQVPDRVRMERLDAMHIWNHRMLDMRFNYRPNYPLYLVLLDVYRLKQRLEIPMHGDYVGCRSWVDLKAPVEAGPSIPVHSPDELRKMRDCILREFE